MANIKQDILDRLYSIFRAQGVVSIEGAYEEDSTGILTFNFLTGEETIIAQAFKYTGVEVNNFVEVLMDIGGKIINTYNAQFDPPPAKEAFFAEVTE